MTDCPAIELPADVVRDALPVLQRTLVDALATGDVTLDARALVTIDTAGLQLLCALVRSASARGVAVRWRGVGPRLAGPADALGLRAALALPREES